MDLWERCGGRAGRGGGGRLWAGSIVFEKDKGKRGKKIQKTGETLLEQQTDSLPVLLERYFQSLCN